MGGSISAKYAGKYLRRNEATITFGFTLYSAPANDGPGLFPVDN
jgi:hypothetical protein